MRLDPGPIIQAAVIAIVGYFFYQWFTRDVLKSAEEAGSWVAENIINPTLPFLTLACYADTAGRGAAEGFPSPDVPDTPAGMAPSNWTWTLKDGTKLGLPPCMTPMEFCRGTPTAPICREIMSTTNGAGGR